ncbi:MAG: 2-amino-4-hydroxy-6-hydroxymethyldihydropteridine diphosphokinase [Bacteroidia bacterium]
MSEFVFIGVGGNLPPREMYLMRALWHLRQAGVEVVRMSSLYETEPWGGIPQPKYLNAVWEVRTSLSPSALLSLLKQIEIQSGRRPSTFWGPREIDLDILVYGQRVLRTSNLVLPHPYIPQRAFVLVPWAEIAPYFYLPVWQQTVRSLLHTCGMQGVSFYGAAPLLLREIPTPNLHPKLLF